MKNIIKIIAIFGIITSFFSAYPMEVEPGYYKINPSTLKRENPLSRNFRAEWVDGHKPVSSSHSLYKEDGGLALMLTAVKIFEEPDNVKNEETLQTVRDAVRDGIPIMSRFVSKARGGLRFIRVFYSENPTSILISVDDLCANQLVVSFSKNERAYRKAIWTKAVCEGHRKREEEICNKLIVHGRDVFKIAIPKVIASLIFEFSSETGLIKQAERKLNETSSITKDLIKKTGRKFDKEQQVQSGLNETSSIAKDLINYACKNFRQIGLVVIVATLFYFSKKLLC